jgi:hypothetical protein
MRINAEREVAQNLRSQTVTQPNVLESDHPALSDKFSIRRPNHCPAVVLDRYGTHPPARIPVQNCAGFLQDYGNPAIAVGPKSVIPPMFPRVVMVSDPLTDGWYLGTRTPIAPCSSSARIAQRLSLAGRGRPHGSLRPLQNHLICRCPASRPPRWPLLGPQAKPRRPSPG